MHLCFAILKDGTYFARLVLSAENESTEEDHRDRCAAQRLYRHGDSQSAPIFVSLDAWDEVEDMTEMFRNIQQEGSDTEQSDEEEESEATVTSENGSN